MRSGDYSISYDDEFYRNEFARIMDRHFEQRSFSIRSALVSKQPVNGNRIIKDYHGGDYDKSIFDLVENMWDHEHCSVCYFKIKDGYTYWENKDGIILLCDACYEAFDRGIQSP